MGPIAQSVEQRTFNPWVDGSSPSGPTSQKSFLHRYYSQMTPTPYSNVVVWGLSNVRHSHRYIHRGFYESLLQSGINVTWVSDSKRSQSAVSKGSVVIAVGFASKFLPIRKDTKYILHNFDADVKSSLGAFINLQVTSKDSQGINIDESVAQWDSDSRTLFQPWGLPEHQSQWLETCKTLGKTEYWVGAVWNNSLNQGNLSTIRDYQEELDRVKVRFKKVGGTRGISKEGLTSEKAFSLVNTSPIGAAIVGTWQKLNGYIPCRTFKNIAAGALPISNANFSHVFGDSYIYEESLDKMIEVAMNMNARMRLELNSACKEKLSSYTYSRAFKRMLEVLN